MRFSRCVRLLLAVMLVLVPAVVGVLAGAGAQSWADPGPDSFTITPSAGAHGAIDPDQPQTVASGADQSFSITADPGYHVADVLVDGESVGARTGYTFAAVDADHTISATFAVDTFTITPSAGANGSITPATPQTVTYGASRSFTITPDVGYHVADVLVDGKPIGPQNSYTFTNVTADHTISATFAVNVFTITPTAGLHGSISPAGPQAVDHGGSQAFSITPDVGYHVADVRVDGSSVGALNGYTFTNVRADHTISATFAVDTFTITPSAGANGAILPATKQTVAYGSDTTFTITPDVGYHVADVLVDDVSVGAVTSHTIANVTADHTIRATFAIDAFTITPSFDKKRGSISPPNPPSVNYGDSLTFTITASEGYYVADVLVDGESVGPTREYTFNAVAADHTLSARFELGVQTGLWIGTTRSVVSYGGSTLLQGELSDPRGPVGLGGRPVTVQYATSGVGPWEVLDPAQDPYLTSSAAGELGRFSVTISPKVTTYYRLLYEKQPLSLYGSVLSENRKVGVRPALGRPAKRAAVKARRWFSVTGSLKPHFAAGQKTVKIKVYRYRNGRWRYMKALRAVNVDNGSFTKYRLRTRLTARGKYRFRATMSGGGWVAATTSYSKTLVVK